MVINFSGLTFVLQSYNPVMLQTAGSYYKISIISPASALLMLRTAQNFPHMLQVSLWSSSGARLARTALAVSGSMASFHWASQSSFRRAYAMRSYCSRAWGMPLAISAAWAAILLAMIPCFTSSTFGNAKCSAGVT